MVVACAVETDERPGPSTAASSHSADVAVSIASMRFTPDVVEIALGETVKWVWEDDALPHDVAFDDGVASPKQNSGSWGRTFDEAGNYRYTCTIHPMMTGMVVVG
jgi:plastocyanin